MKVALGSIFRDSCGYLPTYIQQCREFAATLKARGDSLRVIWAEGDSTDDTFDQLMAALDADLPGRLIRCPHGGPTYGSVDDVNRWRQIAPVCNAVLAQVDPAEDAVIYVESDLVWEAGTMLQLLKDLTPDEDPEIATWPHAPGIDAISPMVWLGKPGSNWFYDVYAFRAAGGRHFSAFYPYNPLFESWEGIVPVESVGSCIVMRGEVARTCRFGLDTCLIGESVAEHGFGLWVDAGASIWHPA